MADKDYDMFMSQEQNEQDGDDLYTSWATTITAKKCKIMQKKARLKQMVKSIHNIDRELISWKEKVAAMENEQREIMHQEKLLIMNINGLQQNRTAQESVIQDLNRQIATLKKEIQENQEMFKAALQDANETWERYKKEYEEFPLAKKRQELRNKILLIEIEIKKTKMIISDIKYQSNKKREIEDKRRNATCIELAQMYIDSQKKMTENKMLENKIREMKQKLADIKAGKQSSADKVGTTNNVPTNLSIPSKSFPTQTKLSPPKASIWKLPQILKPKTPPLRSSIPNIGINKFGGFDWTSLLQSSSLKKFSSTFLSERKTTSEKPLINENRQGPNAKRMKISSTDNTKALNEEEKQQVKKKNSTGITVNNIEKEMPGKLTEKGSEKSVMSCDKNKTNVYTVQASEKQYQMKKNDEKIINKTAAVPINVENGNKNQEKPLSSDLDSHLLTSSNGNDKENMNLNDVNRSEENHKQKDLSFDPHLYLNAKLSNVKIAIEPVKNRIEQELPSANAALRYLGEANLSSINKRIEPTRSKSIEPNRLVQGENEAMTINNNPLPVVRNQVISHEKMTNSEVENRDTRNTRLNHELISKNVPHKEKILSDNINNPHYEYSQTENYTNSIQPSPPPDLVPVENNNHQLSQSSQEIPDFYSPVELDAAGKIHYARLQAESPPPHVYLSGVMYKNMASAQSNIATKGQSKYFTNMPQLPARDVDENLHSDSNDEYLPPYSPPGAYEATLPYLSPSGFQSPPGLQYGNNSSDQNEPEPKESSIFGIAQKKKSNQDDGFSFGQSKPKSSFFSLF